MLLIDESGKMWIRDILPSDLFIGAQDVLAMFGCFAHAQDARVLGAGKLILFKVFIRKARRFWAVICLIFKSASATLPGQQRPSPASFAARWASLHLLLTEIPRRSGYLLPACELTPLFMCSILELEVEANSPQNSSARAPQCGHPKGESCSLGSDLLLHTSSVLEKHPALT